MSYDPITKQHHSDGYNYCYGCGGQEPVEVLRQMDGWCSSQCEEDNGVKFNFKTGLLNPPADRIL